MSTDDQILTHINYKNYWPHFLVLGSLFLRYIYLLTNLSFYHCNLKGNPHVKYLRGVTDFSFGGHIYCNSLAMVFQCKSTCNFKCNLTYRIFLIQPELLLLFLTDTWRCTSIAYSPSSPFEINSL